MWILRGSQAVLSWKVSLTNCESFKYNFYFIHEGMSRKMIQYHISNGRAEKLLRPTETNVYLQLHEV